MKKSLFFYIFTIFFLIICLLFSAFSNLLKTLSATTEVFATQEKPIIIIDAGHGGIDGGTSGKNGVLEKDINLAISKTLAALFKAGGYNVLETRTEDILLSGNAQTHKKQADLDARLAVAKANQGAIFISIHQNAFPLPSCRGTQVWYSPNDPLSADLASAVQSNVKELLQPQNNRKIKAATSSIYLLRNMKNPSILVECGFLSNDEECLLLSTEDYQKKLSLVIFDAISEKIPL